MAPSFRALVGDSGFFNGYMYGAETIMSMEICRGCNHFIGQRYRYFENGRLFDAQMGITRQPAKFSHTYKSSALNYRMVRLTIFHHPNQYKCSHSWLSIHRQCRNHFRRYAGRIDRQWKCRHHRKILLGR